MSMSNSAKIRRKLIEYSAQGSLAKIKALLKRATRGSSDSESSEPSDSESSGRSDSSSSSSATESSESEEGRRERDRRNGGTEEKRREKRREKRKEKRKEKRRGRSLKRERSLNASESSSGTSSSSSSSSPSSGSSRRGKRRRGDEGKRSRETSSRTNKHRKVASDSDSDSNPESGSDSQLRSDSESGGSFKQAAAAAAEGGKGRQEEADDDERQREKRSRRKDGSPSEQAAASAEGGKGRRQEEADEDEWQGKKRSRRKSRSPSPRYKHRAKRRDKSERHDKREKRRGREKEEGREKKETKRSSNRHRSKRKERRESKSSHRRHGKHGKHEDRKKKQRNSTSKGNLVLELNSSDAQGWTPLHHAAHSGSADLVKYLLKILQSLKTGDVNNKREKSGKNQKAPVLIQDNRGNTPAHVAARMGHAAVIKLLRDAGADMQVRNMAGETPEALVQRRLLDLQRRVAEAASERAGSMWGEGSDNEGYFGGGGGGGDGYGYGYGSCNAALWGDSEDSREPAATEARDFRSGLPSGRSGGEAWGGDDSWRDDVAEHMKRKMRRDEEGHRAAVFGAKQQEAEEKRRRWEEGRAAREEAAKKVLEEEVAKDKAWRTAVKEQVQGKRAVQIQERYEERWRRFAKSCDMGITFSDVPFPVEAGREEELKQVVLHGVPREQHRKRMREEVVRWHPDKFMQKWGLRLHEKHRSSIEKRVKELSQAVNSVYAALDK